MAGNPTTTTNTQPVNIAPPVPGTTIIVRPPGNTVTYMINNQNSTNGHAGSNSLNPRAFTTVLWAVADVNIGGTVYQGVSCRRVRAELNVGGVSKVFQFEVVDGDPSWWLDGVAYVPDSTFGNYDWNADLASPLAAMGSLRAWVRVQTAGANPDWVEYSVDRVELAFL